ncbi:MAG: PhzF family phenazine biosynthesis protein [Pseudomonadota bacterium]
MEVQRLAAFSDGDSGGNPAGVLIAPTLPDEPTMRSVAADVGFSETAFAAPDGDGFRVRYFSPESEVPFCGHATIALGAALALRDGDGVFNLRLNDAAITVEGQRRDDTVSAALQSPPTSSRPLSSEELAEALALFGYETSEVDQRIAPARAHGGADHWFIALDSREALASMRYALDAGRDMMRRHGLVTITLAWAESAQRWHTRNAFASGGVYEDPATGAATAAMAGYLRDVDWPHAGHVRIVQGEDMQMRSLLDAQIPPTPGASIRVSGTVRTL